MGNLRNSLDSTDPSYWVNRVIYTNGFIESLNAQEEMLGIQGFAEIVQTTATLPPRSMKQAILDKVAAWRSGPPSDDMSLVIAGVP
jgi:serine phosphatase RsbU (regulator of sigma subunit)